MTAARFTVVWAETGARDLEEIVSYVAEDSPANAQRLLDRIRKKADSLHTLPERGRGVPELEHFGISAFRQIVITPYRLIYRIEEKRVFVLAVLHGRRDLQDLLMERLLRAEGKGAGGKRRPGR